MNNALLRPPMTNNDPELFQTLSASLQTHERESAFLINGESFSYADLARSVSDKKAWIRTHLPAAEKIVGIIANDDLHTYASILALWSEGKAYLPIAPEAPLNRNEVIIGKAGLSTVFSSAPFPSFSIGAVTVTPDFPSAPFDVSFARCSEDDVAYVLFTSGTTGQPKGVPITRRNLAAFIDAFDDMGITVGPSDRGLQMFELTFDVSVMSYLVPLLNGACACTIPKGVVKYAFIAELLEEARINLALMVPSIINYLRPYFEEIDLPHLQHNLFCGEALPTAIATEWSRCVPNARIVNVYGPTGIPSSAQRMIFGDWIEQGAERNSFHRQSHA
ncbi:MAG: AMP-binding protein [Flavobacteriales bacterium]|nr:AMP-binding protein [Flavobacteriales bacterium]